MYKRSLNIKDLVAHKSLFLFGARQTGKSTLLELSFPTAKTYNLLLSDVFHRLSSNPALIRQELKPEDQIIIIDEIQKLPELLDEVHYLIEHNKNLRFILTGSSARSLHRRGVNLLAGRAWVINLYPLTSSELESGDYERLINQGGLPAIYDSHFHLRDLESYVGTYLKEEIVSEGVVRNIPVFSRFLSFASMYNGEQVNFTNLASDIGVAPNTVREYFQILEDTLIGHLVTPFKATGVRKVVSKSKFYLFDLGVAGFLSKNWNIKPGSQAYGKAIEQLIFLELKAYLSYTEKRNYQINYWRTVSKLEVDFVVNGKVAIEVKASNSVKSKDCKGLLALGEEVKELKKIIVCNDTTEHVLDNGVQVYPLNVFLAKLWAGLIIT